MSVVLSVVSNSIPDRQVLFLFLGTTDLQTQSFNNSEFGVCSENMLSDIIFKQARNVKIFCDVRLWGPINCKWHSRQALIRQISNYIPVSMLLTSKDNDLHHHCCKNIKSSKKSLACQMKTCNLRKLKQAHVSRHLWFILPVRCLPVNPKSALWSQCFRERLVRGVALPYSKFAKCQPKICWSRVDKYTSLK
jgi:hypothetical protein